ncbi:MAG: restriction endonuclease subunit S [bacterium]|nr:restriction endonuclease subunit S [bacterium]
MKVRLGDIASYINGYAFKPEDRGSNGLPIIRIQDLTGNAYDLGFYNGDYPKKIEINNGDVLISWSASLGVYIWDRGKALLNQHIFKVLFDKVPINKQYFVYAVQCKLNEMKSQAHGATMKHIIKKDFDNITISFPSLQQQEKIAHILSNVSDIICFRKKQLQLLDSLIKGRFVEMFGDPVSNPKGWPTRPLLTMGSCKNGMNFHSNDSGVVLNCLGVGDFKDFDVITDTHNLPSISLNEMPTDDYLLKNGDIVFVRSNGNKIMVGRSVLVYPNGNPTTFSGFCIRYRNEYESVLVPYLLRVLKAGSIRKQMYGRGANIQNLNQKTLAALKIPVPPLEAQRKYIDFVAQVDKSLFAVKKALEKAQLLFDSLMQEYFG